MITKDDSKNAIWLAYCDLRADYEQLRKERDQLKAAVSLAIDAFHKYEMDVDTYPTVDHVRMMDQLNAVLAKHDAEVIEEVASQLASDGRNYCYDRMEYQSGYLAASMDVYTMANQRRQKAQENES